MKDKILIGEKMTKKGVFLNYLGLVFFGNYCGSWL